MLWVKVNDIKVKRNGFWNEVVECIAVSEAGTMRSSNVKKIVKRRKRLNMLNATF